MQGRFCGRVGEFAIGGTRTDEFVVCKPKQLVYGGRYTSLEHNGLAAFQPIFPAAFRGNNRGTFSMKSGSTIGIVGGGKTTERSVLCIQPNNSGSKSAYFKVLYPFAGRQRGQ